MKEINIFQEKFCYFLLSVFYSIVFNRIFKSCNTVPKSHDLNSCRTTSREDGMMDKLT